MWWSVSWFHLHNTSATRELSVYLDGLRLRHECHSTYLGVTLDRTLSYREHLTKTAGKLKNRNNLLKLASSTWGASSIPSYIGWMFPSESCTNSASWCSTVCTVKCLSTSWNCANQSQVSHHGNIFAPPPDNSWSYRVTSSAPMADGLSVWLVRRSGIPCRTTCVTRLLAGTVSDNL